MRATSLTRWFFISLTSKNLVFGRLRMNSRKEGARPGQYLLAIILAFFFSAVTTAPVFASGQIYQISNTFKVNGYGQGQVSHALELSYSCRASSCEVGNLEWEVTRAFNGAVEVVLTLDALANPTLTYTEPSTGSLLHRATYRVKLFENLPDVRQQRGDTYDIAYFNPTIVIKNPQYNTDVVTGDTLELEVLSSKVEVGGQIFAVVEREIAPLSFPESLLGSIYHKEFEGTLGLQSEYTFGSWTFGTYTRSIPISEPGNYRVLVRSVDAPRYRGSVLVRQNSRTVIRTFTVE